MKKKKICILVAVFGLLLILIAMFITVSLRCGCIDGRILIADNGAYFIVLDDHSPIRMNDASMGGGLFAELQTGDRVRVIHGGIAESYPGRASVYYLRRLEKGTAEDVFPDVIQTLTALGWFQK